MAWGKGGGGLRPSRRTLAVVAVLVGIYILGRMEGEGRFTWASVFSEVWGGVTNLASAASDSAKGVVGM